MMQELADWAPAVYNGRKSEWYEQQPGMIDAITEQRQNSEWSAEKLDLKEHIIDTIKEWQLKIGYREGNMKLYYPGESLAVLLGMTRECAVDHALGEDRLADALAVFCEETEPILGRIKVTGNYQRYCLDIPAKGCAYVAGKVPEPAFLKAFLAVIAQGGNAMNPVDALNSMDTMDFVDAMDSVREFFASYAKAHGTSYVEEKMEEEQGEEHCDEHISYAFYFTDATVEAYVYLVEFNEFGITYHRFTREEYETLVSRTV